MIMLSIALLLAQPSAHYAERIFSPREAVEAAADAEGHPVHGIFVIRVQGTGARDRRVYLNSERDYRDQRNLTVSIDNRTAAQLERWHGAPAQDYLRGRTIRLFGAAQRVRIDFLDPSGRPTGKYYYQTHVRVNHPRQLQLID